MVKVLHYWGAADQRRRTLQGLNLTDLSACHISMKVDGQRMTELVDNACFSLWVVADVVCVGAVKVE